jgi:hypothetical protein
MNYGIPTPGEAIAIGSNTLQSIRPAGFSSGGWPYSLIGCYGGGTFVPDYSTRGGYVIASSGGHGCPRLNVDAVIFDFDDATWKLQKNANGISIENSYDPTGHADYVVADTTDWPYYEILGATAGNIPVPSHTYQSITYIPTSMGGGPRGSYMKLTSTALCRESGGTGASHRLDLATGLWTRVSESLFAQIYFEAMAVFDPETKRYYNVLPNYHAYGYLEYLDGNDWQVKKTAIYAGWPPTPTGADWLTAFLDPIHRLIIIHDPGSTKLLALDLNDVASGWFFLNTSGSLALGPNRWHYYPVDGRFYHRDDNSGQVLDRITPPTGDFRTGTWVVDKVTLTGATIPDMVGWQTRHYSRFFYIPAIESFGWIADENSPVIIMKPPQ